MVAGGGASGLNVVPIARELGCRRVIVPATAGALSACGALYADVVSDFSGSLYAESHTMDVAAVDTLLSEVEQLADAFLTELDGIGPRATRKEFMAEARYRAQVWELEVPIRPRLRDAEGVLALEEAFHAAHERVFAVREPGQYLECLLWRVRATAELSKPDLRARALAAGSALPAAIAPAYFGESGLVDIPRFDGEALPAGTRIEGPAIVREPTTTIVVYPGSGATVTALGNYLLEVSA
jgi:N-methylhydantoinase A